MSPPKGHASRTATAEETTTRSRDHVGGAQRGPQSVPPGRSQEGRPTSTVGRGVRLPLPSILRDRSRGGRQAVTPERGAPDPAPPAHGECGRPETRERGALKRRAPAAPAEAEATITFRRRTRPRVARYPRPERWNPSYAAQSLYIQHAARERQTTERSATVSPPRCRRSSPRRRLFKEKAAKTVSRDTTSGEAEAPLPAGSDPAWPRAKADARAPVAR
jgi:hypothetical protein